MLIDIFELLKDKAFTDNYVSNSIESVKRHLPDIKAIANASRFHANTKRIEKLSIERREMLRGLRLAINGDLTAETEEKRAAAEVLSLWIRPERKNFGSHRVKIQTGMVDRLLEDMSYDSEITDALELLQLDARFDIIAEKSDEITRLTGERTKVIEAKPKGSKNIRKQCNRDMHTLLSAFAGMANREGEERAFYHGVCKEIQSCMKAANSIILLRQTRNANAEADVPEADLQDDSDKRATEPEVDTTTELNGSSE